MITHAMLLPQINLSPAYRLAQRQLAQWLEADQRRARRVAFATRTALAALNEIERGTLARWLAWTCVAARSQGIEGVLARLQRLDTSLGVATEARIRQLPTDGISHPGHRLRHSA